MSKAGLIRILILATVGTFFFYTARPAAADSIQYVATSTYTSGTSTSAYSAPNKTFTFSFSEPQTISSLTTSVPVTLTLGSGACCTYSGIGEVIFYSAAQLGLFDIDLTVGGDTFTWEFFGPQLYSGSGAPYTLSAATFPIDGSGSTTSEFYDSKGLYSGSFNAGSVAVTNTPEPSSLLLLGCGLLALGPLVRRRMRGAPVEA